MKTLVCVSVFGRDEEELGARVAAALNRGADLVEARIDLSDYGDLEKLSAVLRPFAEKLVLTCRPVDEGGRSTLSRDERIGLLSAVAGSGVGYIDAELSAVDADAAARLKRVCRTLIVSWHNYETTPETEFLVGVGRECLRYGDVAKVVTFSHGEEDNFRILSLYSFLPRHRLVAFCMGEKGWVTRIVSMAAGAPIAYASLDEQKTAPGQLKLEEMVEARDLIVKGVAGD